MGEREQQPRLIPGLTAQLCHSGDDLRALLLLAAVAAQRDERLHCPRHAAQRVLVDPRNQQSVWKIGVQLADAVAQKLGSPSARQGLQVSLGDHEFVAGAEGVQLGERVEGGPVVSVPLQYLFAVPHAPLERRQNSLAGLRIRFRLCDVPVLLVAAKRPGANDAQPT